MRNISVLEDDFEKKEENILIENSKGGLPVVIFNGYYLNSKYNPLKESKQLADKYYKKNYTHVLFGLAHSYLAKELLNKMGENDFLLIIEPSIKLFEMVNSKGALEPLLESEQVFFIVGYEHNQLEEEIRYLVNTRNIGQLEFIPSPNYERLYPHLLKHLKEEIIKNVRLSLVNIATMVKYGKLWQENTLYNLYNSWKSTPFKKIENKFDCPVIIAASGPSLNKQLGKLKEIRENQSALIIAAGSTINPLLKAGIKPHIVVSIDGAEANWKHFEGLDYDDVSLFYSLNVHKEIPLNHNGVNVIFNSQDKDLSDWINKIVGEDLGYVFGGASVANYCFYIAKKITSGPICLIGQDLAYTDNVSHAVGNSNLKKISENETNKNKNYIEVKSYYGKTILSDYSLLSMKKVFEDMIDLFRKSGDKRHIYNCTEGGAKIEGINNLDFEDFIKNYCSMSYNKEFIDTFLEEKNNFISKSNISSGFEIEQKNLQELVRMTEKAIEIINGLSMDTVYIDNKALKKLDTLDDKINEYSKSNIIYFLIMPLSFQVNHTHQEVEGETLIERKRRVMKKSLALYKGILESAEYTLKILDTIESERKGVG